MVCFNSADLWWKASEICLGTLWGTLMVYDTLLMTGACHIHVAEPVTPIRRDVCLQAHVEV